MIRRVSATFQCAVCGLETETVRFLPKGDASNYTSSDAISYDFGSETMALSKPESAKVREALAAADAAALHAAHPRWLATYCPACRACYCKSHWRIENWPDPDSDSYSMHFDTYGTCPAGHKRLMAKDSLAWPEENGGKGSGIIVVPE